MVHIESAFEGGNGRCLAGNDPLGIEIEIERDTGCDSFQWFSFRVYGARATDCRYRLVNAHAASFAKGWEGYDVMRSCDGERWSRIPSRYAEGALTFEDRVDADEAHYAYFAPYPLQRLAQQRHMAMRHPSVRMEVLGLSCEGRAIHCLHIGEDGPGKRHLWITSRQHPGETQASWWVEGFLQRLLAPEDALAAFIRSRAVCHVVPLVNPDGAVHGNLRANANGTDPNRQWADPDPQAAPEVFCVRQAMMRSGVDFSFDIHADEKQPCNFIYPATGVAAEGSAVLALLDQYRRAYCRASREMVMGDGPPDPAPGSGAPGMCMNWVTTTFDCLAMTLEMPFKDTANITHMAVPWGPERAMRFGAAALDGIAELLPVLR